MPICVCKSNQIRSDHIRSDHMFCDSPARDKLNMRYRIAVERLHLTSLSQYLRSSRNNNLSQLC